MGFGDSNKMKWGDIEDKKIFSLREISERINKNTIIIITVANVNDVEQIVETLRECGLSETKFYTYFALENTIKIHIDDKRILREYKERVKIEKMVCRAYIMSSLELDGLAMIQDIILCNKSILILQPGKGRLYCDKGRTGEGRNTLYSCAYACGYAIGMQKNVKRAS